MASIRATFSAGLLLSVALASSAQAQSAERGRRLAAYYCAKCHAVDRYSPSPMKSAPPLRTLPSLYPIELLEEALAEGITTSSPNMPEFSFEPDQVADFIAYLKMIGQ